MFSQTARFDAGGRINWHGGCIRSGEGEQPEAVNNLILWYTLILGYRCTGEGVTVGAGWGILPVPLYKGVNVKNIFTRRQLISMGIVTPPLWIVAGLAIKNELIDKKDVTTDLLLTRQYFNYHDMKYQQEKYFQFAPEILTAYGNLKRDQRVALIKENWRLSQLLSFENPYEGLAIPTLESFFVTTVKHDYGETGLYGIKLGTARFAKWVQSEYMPEHLSRKMPIVVDSKKDLTDIKNAMRVMYSLLWYYRRLYDNQELWYVSVYHWGGFIAKYFDMGYIPEKFTINDIEYGVLNYYIAYREIVACYSQGRLEPVADVVRRYKRNIHKITQKELTFRRLYKILNGYDKRIKGYEDAVEEKFEKLEELKRYKKESDKEMLKISSDAKRGKAKYMIKRIKDVAKKFLKRISK